MPSVFFTGFPGFLGSELLPRVLARDGGTEAICLVQPKFAALARSRADAIERAHPALAGRIRVVEGDITSPGLGLGDARELRGRVREVYHLAAVYDLSVGLGPAMKVNVDGTRHVLDFAKGCAGLERFQYVSTCYVSGRYPGVFTEDHLEEGQSFNNHYEETKYLAEVEVQHEMRHGLPATIYRPAIVVGDSTTGATQKYDGPYFVIQWLLRQPGFALMPVVGDPAATELNVVPRDFVTEAIAYLSGQPRTEGRVYQLADPRPLTVDAMLDELSRATGRTLVRIPLPKGVAKGAIDHVPGVHALMRIPSSAIDYFVHPTRYGTAQATADLAGSGIRCPRFPEYAERLVEFVRQHPEIGSAAMV
jgi:thioester reductase-like protein